jgi:hypothetical protein
MGHSAPGDQLPCPCSWRTRSALLMAHTQRSRAHQLAACAETLHCQSGCLGTSRGTTEGLTNPFVEETAAPGLGFARQPKYVFQSAMWPDADCSCSCRACFAAVGSGGPRSWCGCPCPWHDGSSPTSAGTTHDAPTSRSTAARHAPSHGR